MAKWKIDNNQANKLNNEIRRFNELLDKSGNRLIDKFDVYSVMEKLTTKNEYNSFINALQKANESNLRIYTDENGIKKSEFLDDIIKISSKREGAQIKAREKFLSELQDNPRIGIEREYLNRFKNINTQSKYNNAANQAISPGYRFRKSDSVLKTNYLDAIDRSVLDDRQKEIITKAVDKMSPSNLYKMYVSKGLTLRFLYISGADDVAQTEYNQALEALHEFGAISDTTFEKEFGLT